MQKIRLSKNFLCKEAWEGEGVLLNENAHALENILKITLKVQLFSLHSRAVLLT